MTLRQRVECVPNISEGRDADVVRGVAQAAARVDGVALLGVDSDPDHHRTVISFAGSVEAVAQAAFALAEQAVKRIDLSVHRGAHPRMGSLDVVPFVPLQGTTMDDCVALARQVGERIARELRVPVYLYGEAATRPERRNLATVRRGGFEGLSEKIKHPQWEPDFGAPMPHPTAGATAVGARAPLIAFNVNLDTEDLDLARQIAKKVRCSSGGLPCVKALGFALPQRHCVQVSMNMTDYERTGLYEAFELIKQEAARAGVGVLESEIVGLTPQRALLDSAQFYLKLDEFSQGQILEHVLAEAERDG